MELASGMDIKIKQTGTPQPFLGIVNAIAIPNGSCINKIIKVKIACLPKDAWNLSECKISLNHLVPSHAKTLLPKVS